MNRKDQLRTELEEVRKRTLGLLERVPDEFLRVRVHNFYSPIGWHFGHVGRTEEFWVCEATGQSLRDPRLSFLYADLPENPKDNRVHIPDRSDTIAYLRETRASSLLALDEADLDSDAALLQDGYAWSFAVQHECQHQETIMEMLQLIQKQRQPEGVEVIPWQSSLRSEMISHPGGTFRMGDTDVHGYDNERDAHQVTMTPFRLAKYPVTSFEWSEFMSAAGYWREELWSRQGWEWRCQSDAWMPEYWIRQTNGYSFFGAFGIRPIHPEEPVSSISHYEAEAYAHWKGLRLPTEAEWEYAASSAGQVGGRRRFAWGSSAPDAEHANFGIATSGPNPVADCSLGETPLGVSGMTGNVWEWTSTTFGPYPGFRAFPYDGYSLDHMRGEHFVCRGGSWATSATICRNTFRNWYVPSYRQGFLGLRLAGD